MTFWKRYPPGWFAFEWGEDEGDGDEGSGDEGSGDEPSGDEGPGDEGPGDQGSGDESDGDAGVDNSWQRQVETRQDDAQRDFERQQDDDRRQRDDEDRRRQQEDDDRRREEEERQRQIDEQQRQIEENRRRMEEESRRNLDVNNAAALIDTPLGVAGADAAAADPGAIPSIREGFQEYVEQNQRTFNPSDPELREAWLLGQNPAAAASPTQPETTAYLQEQDRLRGIANAEDRAAGRKFTPAMDITTKGPAYVPPNWRPPGSAEPAAPAAAAAVEDPTRLFSTSVPPVPAAAPAAASAQVATIAATAAAQATAQAGGTPAQVAAAAEIGARAASDRQTLGQQSAWTRAAFRSQYGADAEAQWARQHNEELARNRTLYGSPEPRAGTAPLGTAPAGTQAAPDRRIGRTPPPTPDQTGRYGINTPRQPSVAAAAAAAPAAAAVKPVVPAVPGAAAPAAAVPAVPAVPARPVAPAVRPAAPTYNDPTAGGTITTPLPPQRPVSAPSTLRPPRPTYNDPTIGGTISSPIPQPSYNDPTAGGTISVPLPEGPYNDPTAGGTISTPLPPPGASYNDPTAGGTISIPLPQSSYNDPTAGGTISAPLAPAPESSGRFTTDELNMMGGLTQGRFSDLRSGAPQIRTMDLQTGTPPIRTLASTDTALRPDTARPVPIARPGDMYDTPIQDPVITALDSDRPLTALTNLVAETRGPGYDATQDTMHVAGGIGALLRGDLDQDGKAAGAWAEPYLNDVARMAWAKQERQQGRPADPRDTPVEYVEQWKDAFYGSDQRVPLVKEVNQALIDAEVQRTPPGKAFDWRNVYGQTGENGLTLPQVTGVDCGPNAFSTILRSRGYNADVAQTFTYAKTHGGSSGVMYHSGEAFSGPQNMVRMLREEAGVDASSTRIDPGGQGWDQVDKELAEGRPVILSSTGHYWVVSAKNANGQYYAGATALKGQSPWLSRGGFYYGSDADTAIFAHGDVDPNSRAVKTMGLPVPQAGSKNTRPLLSGQTAYETPAQRATTRIADEMAAAPRGASAPLGPSEPNLKPQYTPDDVETMRTRIRTEMPKFELPPPGQGTTEDRMRGIQPAAEWMEREYGYPAELVAGLMVAENGAGAVASPAVRGNNLFSLEWNKQYDKQATGYAPGQGSNPRWAAYPTIEDAFARKMGVFAHPENANYARVWRDRTKGPDAVLDGLVAGGYIVNEPGAGNSIPEWRARIHQGIGQYRKATGRS